LINFEEMLACTHPDLKEYVENDFGSLL